MGACSPLVRGTYTISHGSPFFSALAQGQGTQTRQGRTYCLNESAILRGAIGDGDLVTQVVLRALPLDQLV